jgi:hypothetical protein
MFVPTVCVRGRLWIGEEKSSTNGRTIGKAHGVLQQTSGVTLPNAGAVNRRDAVHHCPFCRHRRYRPCVARSDDEEQCP